MTRVGFESTISMFVRAKTIYVLDSTATVNSLKFEKLKFYGLSPRANYTDRATAACRQSDCQLLRIESATW
jgi:hypothetical protein